MQGETQDEIAPPEEGGIGLVAKMLWSRKWPIALFAASGALIVLILSAIIEPDYTVKMIIMPPPDGGASNLLSQFGSLASAASSLTGLKLPGGGVNQNYTAVVQLLNSPRVYAEVDRKYGVFRLFYPKRWDDVRKTWKVRNSPIDTIVSGFKWAFRIPVHDAPNEDDLARLLKDRLEISQVEFTDIYNVSLRYKDPQVAAQFLNWDLNTADSMVRAEALARIRGEIEYVDQRLKSVTIDEHRRALGDLLASLERQNMIISGGGNYAVFVLQSPAVEVRPSLVTLLVNVLLGFVGGAAIAIAITLLFPTMTQKLDRRFATLFTIGERAQTGAKSDKSSGDAVPRKS
jgi:Chain length determinant protein